MATRRQGLAVTEKLNLLRRYGTLDPTSQRDSANKLGISQLIPFKLRKSRDALMAVNMENGTVRGKKS